MSEKLKNKGKQCPCGSGKIENNCCMPIIQGERKADSAEQLMRSRYVAYALRDSAYILRSWHSSTRPATINMENDVCWTGLRVLSSMPASSLAADTFVEFMADFVSHGKSGQMHENSRFLKEQGEWRYVDGEQLEIPEARLKKLPGRNDLCFCGSGKKFKKCCLGK